MLQQRRIRVTETIYRLLFVADNQVVKSRGKTIAQQRTKVVPLQTRCILELVYQKVPQVNAHALVHKGHIILGHKSAYEVGSIAQQQDIVVSTPLLDAVQHQFLQSVHAYIFSLHLKSLDVSPILGIRIERSQDWLCLCRRGRVIFENIRRTERHLFENGRHRPLIVFGFGIRRLIILQDIRDFAL